jgi:hypothetical protein
MMEACGVGRCIRSQRAVRERLLRAGVEWWVYRSARAAMWTQAVTSPHRGLSAYPAPATGDAVAVAVAPAVRP